MFSAEIIRDSDGGAYAVMVTITNLSATNDLRFRVMDQPNRVFLVGATSHSGELGKPWRTWMPEELHAVEFTVPKKTREKWFIRLESRLVPPTNWPDPT